MMSPAVDNLLQSNSFIFEKILKLETNFSLQIKLQKKEIYIFYLLLHLHLLSNRILLLTVIKRSFLYFTIVDTLRFV